ncbi:MAG: Fis family transcriptional regulator [Butyrivibrio sp.]|nr:Fis family transcriptional regulator [Butyrivibrio sp.]
MKGKHRIIVQNNRLHYEMEIKRNITVIQGDSATGKTSLVDMVRSYSRLGEESGITISCDVPVKVLEGPEWEIVLGATSNSIIIIDEGNSFITSKKFAEKIKATDNYYVIITRENLYQLPYSVEEIYGMHSSGKYQDTRRVYNQLYNIYSS